MSITVTQNVRTINVTIEQNGASYDIQPVIQNTIGGEGGGANFLLKTDAVVGEVYNFSFDYVSGGGTAETCYLIFAQTSTQGNRSFTSPNYKTTGYGTYTGQVTALIKVIKGV